MTNETVPGRDEANGTSSPGRSIGMEAKDENAEDVPETQAAEMTPPPAPQSDDEKKTETIGRIAMDGLQATVAFLRNRWVLLLVLGLLGVGYALLGSLATAFDRLSWKAWFSLASVTVLVGCLAIGLLPSHVLFAITLGVLVAFQCVSPPDSLVGFSNVGVATVAILFMVANGVTRTNALGIMFRYFMGNKRISLRVALFKIVTPLGLASGFLNNTPIFAMAIPVILRWCRTVQYAPSKLLMPINNALILGGTITLIGTSTNLIVSGLAESDTTLVDKDGNPLSFGIFGITKLGIIYFGIGVIYVVIFAPFDALLPERQTYDSQIAEHAKEYMVSMKVSSKAKTVINQTIESAGLRHLRGLFLVEIQRGTSIIPAPAPDDRIEEGDILVFSGQIDTVVDLYKRDAGLVPIQTEGEEPMLSPRFTHSLYEVVVSPNSLLLNGRRIRDVGFRQQFGAAVVAVASSSGSLIMNQKLGDIELHGGDTLLVEAGSRFYRRWGRNSNFALVYPLKDSSPPRDDWPHIIISLAIAAAMVAIAAAEVTGIYTTAIVAALAMLITGCQNIRESGAAVDIPVMMTIALAFGVGKSIETTGAGTAIANFIVWWLEPLGAMGVLFAIYIVVTILTSVITNNGAVAIMFPIVSGILKDGTVSNLDPYAAMYVLMLAGSASFSTPIGYQTNLMAHSAGAYQFSDWVRFGLGLQIVLMIVGVVGAFYLY